MKKTLNRVKEIGYSINDAGCYKDNALHGQYIDVEVIQFAMGHGFDTDIHFHDLISMRKNIESLYELVTTVEDEAISFMNEKYPVKNHFWGYSNLDFGLWWNDIDD